MAPLSSPVLVETWPLTSPMKWPPENVAVLTVMVEGGMTQTLLHVNTMMQT